MVTYKIDALHNINNSLFSERCYTFRRVSQPGASKKNLGACVLDLLSFLCYLELCVHIFRDFRSAPETHESVSFLGTWGRGLPSPSHVMMFNLRLLTGWGQKYIFFGSTFHLRVCGRGYPLSFLPSEEPPKIKETRTESACFDLPRVLDFVC